MSLAAPIGFEKAKKKMRNNKSRNTGFKIFPIKSVIFASVAERKNTIPKKIAEKISKPTFCILPGKSGAIPMV